jgi:CRP-like cAMP-binding protein
MGNIIDLAYGDRIQAGGFVRVIEGEIALMRGEAEYDIAKPGDVFAVDDVVGGAAPPFGGKAAEGGRVEFTERAEYRTLAPAQSGLLERAATLTLARLLRTTDGRITAVSQGRSDVEITAVGIFERLGGGAIKKDKFNVHEALERHAMLVETEREALDEIAKVAKAVRVRDAAALLSQGEAADRAWFITGGDVEFSIYAGNGSDRMGTLSAGSAFGLCPFVDKKLNRITAVSRGEIQAVVIKAKQFDDLITGADAAGGAVRRATIRSLTAHLHLAMARLDQLKARIGAENDQMRHTPAPVMRRDAATESVADSRVSGGGKRFN